MCAPYQTTLTPRYVPAVIRKSLHLLSGLGHTPMRRLRISSPHATLALEAGNAPEREPGANGESTPQPRWRNACTVLQALVTIPALEEALLNEFRGHPMQDVEVLEAACLRHLDGAPPQVGTTTDAHTERARRRRTTGVRLKITQGNQAVWGKLKHRLWDFRERAQWARPGAWAELLDT